MNARKETTEVFLEIKVFGRETILETESFKINVFVFSLLIFTEKPETTSTNFQMDSTAVTCSVIISRQSGWKHSKTGFTLFPLHPF